LLERRGRATEATAPAPAPKIHFFFLRRFAFLGIAAGAFAFLAFFVFFLAAISILWCLVQRAL